MSLSSPGGSSWSPSSPCGHGSSVQGHLSRKNKFLDSKDIHTDQCLSLQRWEGHANIQDDIVIDRQRLRGCCPQGRNKVSGSVILYVLSAACFCAHRNGAVCPAVRPGVAAMGKREFTPADNARQTRPKCSESVFVSQCTVETKQDIQREPRGNVCSAVQPHSRG